MRRPYILEAAAVAAEAETEQMDDACLMHDALSFYVDMLMAVSRFLAAEMSDRRPDGALEDGTSAASPPPDNSQQ